MPSQALGGTDSHVAAGDTEKEAKYVPGQLIIKIREGATLDENAFKKDYKVKILDKILKEKKAKDKRAEKALKDKGLDRLYLAQLEDGADTEAIMDALRKDPAVESVEKNGILEIAETVPDDPDFSNLWGLRNSGQTGGTSGCDIDACKAWDVQTGNRGVVIAVIDTGVDYNHPDLQPNVWTNIGEIAANGVDDDGNGYVDDVHGYDFCNNDGDPMDDHYHGTHCAGTIGAVGNNGIGVAGVNWQVSIMPLKFLSSSGSGTTAAAISAVIYATAMGADVMSNSWGGGGYSQTLYDAIAAAEECGIIFVAAAGNSGTDNDLSPFYPASYDLGNIIAVAATDAKDAKASFSNWGAVSVDIGAPGVSIYSTEPNGAYGSLSGTSMACPHVAGAVGLMEAQYSDMAAGSIKSRLLSGADKVPALEGKTVSGGRLNVANALETDDIPPGGINDLVVKEISYDSAAISWTATGDDGNGGGTASSYDVRYSKDPITEANWGTAEQANAEPVPAAPGQAETMTVGNLEFGTAYYFALKAIDNAGNEGEISNIASGTTESLVEIFTDDMGSGSYTMSGLWHLEQYRYDSAPSSLAYNRGNPYDYDTGAANTGSARLDGHIDLSNRDYAVLKFDYFYQTESAGTSWDKRTVRIVENGTDNVIQSFQLSGDPMLVWNTYSAAIPCGKDVQIEFVFDSVDAIANGYEGWYIDNVGVYGLVAEINLPPIAEAGADQSSFTGKEILFDGSGSSDPDGEIVSYAWDFGDGATGTGINPSHIYQAAGSYTVNLTVTDDKQATATDNIVVEIIAPNLPPIAEAGADQSSFTGKEILFDGSGSSDPDGEIVSYAWDFGDGATGTGINPSHIYQAAGSYTVNLTVTDDKQATATDSLSVVIAVPDVVTISKAEYDSKKKVLTVYATSSAGTVPLLEVVGFGPMSYSTERAMFILEAGNVPANPGTITVRSSMGGEVIKKVTDKFRR